MDKKTKIILLALVAVAAYFIFTKLGNKTEEFTPENGEGTNPESSNTTSSSTGGTTAGGSGTKTKEELNKEWVDKYRGAEERIKQNKPDYIKNLTGVKEFFTGNPQPKKMAHMHANDKRHYMQVVAATMKQTADISKIGDALRTNGIFPSSYIAPDYEPKLLKGDNVYVKYKIYRDKTAKNLRLENSADLKMMQQESSLVTLLDYLRFNYTKIADYKTNDGVLVVVDIVITNASKHYRIVYFENGLQFKSGGHKR